MVTRLRYHVFCDNKKTHDTAVYKYLFTITFTTSPSDLSCFRIFVNSFSSQLLFFSTLVCLFCLVHHIFHKHWPPPAITCDIKEPLKESLPLQKAAVCCWCYSVRPVIEAVLAGCCNLRKRRCWVSDLWQVTGQTQYWNSGSQTGRGRRRNGPEWIGRGCLARVI